jgi:hypothetical protein
MSDLIRQEIVKYRINEIGDLPTTITADEAWIGAFEQEAKCNKIKVSISKVLAAGKRLST